jgi:hypothetical protein
MIYFDPLFTRKRTVDHFFVDPLGDPLAQRVLRLYGKFTDDKKARADIRRVLKKIAIIEARQREREKIARQRTAEAKRRESRRWKSAVRVFKQEVTKKGGNHER